MARNNKTKMAKKSIKKEESDSEWRGKMEPMEGVRASSTPTKGDTKPNLQEEMQSPADDYKPIGVDSWMRPLQLQETKRPKRKATMKLTNISKMVRTDLIKVSSKKRSKLSVVKMSISKFGEVRSFKMSGWLKSPLIARL